MSEAPAPKRRQWRPRRRPPLVSISDTADGVVGVPLSVVAIPKAVERRRRLPHVRPVLSNDKIELLDKLTGELRKGYECMVCMSVVRYNSPIWTCKTCWAMFHLSCTHQWIKRNIADERKSRRTGALVGWEWRCPGCQYVYVEPELPVYKCFCGSVDNPISSRQITAHSCGEMCSRIRPLCNHPCASMCHPGPCAPCTVLLPRSTCFCGASPGGTGYVRCGSVEANLFSCGKLCLKLCSQNLHPCKNICHSGPCSPCTEVTGSRVCVCGKTSVPTLCGAPCTTTFLCEKPCVKMYACGFHACTKTCHEGPCGDCPKFPTSNVCSCGRDSWVPPRIACTDPFPTCLNVCNRKLSCQHLCQIKCHTGECPPCRALVTETCVCGKSKRSIECSTPREPFRCTQPCRALKSCSKHRCTNLCCITNDHLCLQVCGKPLNCGKHCCDNICHLGKCHPCRIVVRTPQSCGCRFHVQNPPFACGTPPPECFRICNKKLPNCDHLCQSVCHSGPCSLCTVLGPKVCAGGHETFSAIPCHVESLSCGKKCGKPLFVTSSDTSEMTTHMVQDMLTDPTHMVRHTVPDRAQKNSPQTCGQRCGHLCIALCHGGPCSNAPCTQPCELPRSNCEHPCGAPCHSPEPCPDLPCTSRVRLSCPCGLHVEDVLCDSGATVSCSQECATAARLAKLRDAFRSDISGDEQYSGELVACAEKFSKYVFTLDTILFEAASNRSQIVHLPHACSARRWLTLEYALIHYRFNATVVAPDFHVSVSFVTGETRPPSPTLTALLEMTPSKQLPYIIDFDSEIGPQIHLYDVAKGFGRLTTEKIYALLHPANLRGCFRTRRGEKWDMFLDFVDPNKAVTAFRLMQNSNGPLTQCTLVNVQLVNRQPTPDRIKIVSDGWETVSKTDI